MKQQADDIYTDEWDGVESEDSEAVAGSSQLSDGQDIARFIIHQVHLSHVKGKVRLILNTYLPLRVTWCQGVCRFRRIRIRIIKASTDHANMLVSVLHRFLIG